MQSKLRDAGVTFEFGSALYDPAFLCHALRSWLSRWLSICAVLLPQMDALPYDDVSNVCIPCKPCSLFARSMCGLACRGVFGAHVSMVMRRLLRVCTLYTTQSLSSTIRHRYVPVHPLPRFITCSATMASPREHFSTLLPLEKCLGGADRLTCVTKDTSPQGSKT